MQTQLAHEGGKVVVEHRWHLQSGKVAALLEVHGVLQVGELVLQLPVRHRGQVIAEAGAAHGNRRLDTVQLQIPVRLGHILQVEARGRGGRVGQVIDHQVVQHRLQAEDRYNGAKVLLQAGICAGLELLQDVRGQAHRTRGQGSSYRIRLGSLNVEVAALLQQLQPLVPNGEVVVLKEPRGQVLLRIEAAVDALDDGQRGVEDAHVRMVTNHVLRIESGQVAANNAAPVAALYKELLVAQTQHQVAHHGRHLGGIEAGTRGSLAKG